MFQSAVGDKQKDARRIQRQSGQQAREAAVSAYGNQALLRMGRASGAMQPVMPLRPSQAIALQRKCACGGSTTAGGKCEDCEKKKTELQPKLSMGASNDPLEREADHVAEHVMKAPARTDVSGTPPHIQRFTGQATVGQSAEVPDSVVRVLSSSGKPLDTPLRTQMESRFGHDFSGVRIHLGSAAEQSARQVNALAYTVGSNIVFGSSQFSPETHDGQKLLAHELTHTIQQSGFGGANLIQRNCRNHPDQSYYAGAANYCRDTGFTGMLHPGRTCYREVPRRSSYFECPPGDQVCFNENGTCEDSYDEASPVESKNGDGSCNLHHGCTWTSHVKNDVVPGLIDQATQPLAEGMSYLEREIYKLYGVPYY